MTVRWTRSVHPDSHIVEYTSEQAPGYRIEHWDSVWAVMLTDRPVDLMAFTRHSLTAAKLGVQEELDGVPTYQRKRY